MAHKNPALSPLRRREVWAWCGYDFANSAFPTLIVTVAYSVYFVNVVVPAPLREDWGDLLWGLSLSTSMILVVLSAPVLGALADRAAHKRRYLLFYTLLCVAATAALAGVGPGEVAAGMGLFVVANLGFESALIFYNAFLPSLAPPAYRGRVSGWGWGAGYVGGLLCLVLAFLLVGGFGAENASAFRASFPLVAAFYLVFSLPTFLWVPEGERRKQEGFSLLGAAGQVLHTLRSLRRERELLRFLVAFFLYNNGVITVIAFSSLYAVNTLKFSEGEVFPFFIAVQLAAGVGAWALGHVGDRLGLRRTLEGTLWNWCFVVVLAYASPNKETFWVAGLLAGLSLGSTQSLSRSFMAAFAPAGREAEFFSFYGVCGKTSSILGPMVFGIISTLTGSQRTAILSVLFFLGAGLLLLRGVGERGRETEAG